jgi:hypothetical protein
MFSCLPYTFIYFIMHSRIRECYTESENVGTVDLQPVGKLMMTSDQCLLHVSGTLRKPYALTNFKRALGEISSTVLAARLLEMEREGLIAKKSI